MASYVLLIKSDTTDVATMQRAYDRAIELCESPHELCQVFLYGASTLLANKDVNAASGVPNFRALWQSLAKKHLFPLVACSTVGSQYGLIAPPEPDSNFAEHFAAGGLTEFMSLLPGVDHVEQF